MAEGIESATGPTQGGAGGLEVHGLTPSGDVLWNLPPARLYEEALSRGEARMAHMGGLAVETAPHTGRSPEDRFIVRDPSVRDTVDWGPVNAPMSPDGFHRLRDDMVATLNGKALFVRDARAGENADVGIGVRVITPSSWHSLFAYNMFLRPAEKEMVGFVPDLTVLHDPEFRASPERHGTRTETVVAVSFEERLIVIGGTRYAGEIKKSVFSVLNHVLPDHDVLPMHCSANVGSSGDVALFFGLSGTGKTTLSADPDRGLIGDDEHGWGVDGVFNFEGGCYAKAIRLSSEDEPEIYQATRMFGTLLENVVLDPRTRGIDYEDGSITQNTRASYPIHYIPNAVLPGKGGHPQNVVFLTCDAFGVLPPISRLTPAQAMYHFLSGYTAKVAGTEQGIDEPKAAFSACFGAPFLPRQPGVYASMLGDKLREHGSQVWLVNTGWTGGGVGTGTRIALRHTRQMVRAALAGHLDEVETARDPNFGLIVPTRVPDVPAEILMPRETWDEGDVYDEAARRLAAMFVENFRKYESGVDAEVSEAGPEGGH